MSSTKKPKANLDALVHLRVKNLRALVDLHSPTAVARKMGLANTSYISHMTHGQRGVSEKSARKIEAALSLPVGWMDVEHDATAPRETASTVLLQVTATLDTLPAVDGISVKQRRLIVAHACEYGGPRVDSGMLESLIEIARG